MKQTRGWMEGVGPEGQETGTGDSQSRGRGKKNT